MDSGIPHNTSPQVIGADLDAMLEVARTALEPARGRLDGRRGETWSLTVYGSAGAGGVELAGRPQTCGDRVVWAVLAVEPAKARNWVVISASTDSWLDSDGYATCWFDVGEQEVPSADAGEMIASMVPPLVLHLEDVLRRLDAGERGDVM